MFHVFVFVGFLLFRDVLEWSDQLLSALIGYTIGYVLFWMFR